MINSHISRERERSTSLDSNRRSPIARLAALVTAQIIACEIGNGGVVVGVLADVLVVGVGYAAVGELFEDI